MTKIIPYAAAKFRIKLSALKVGESLIYFKGWTDKMSKDERAIFEYVGEEAHERNDLFLSQSRHNAKGGYNNLYHLGFIYSVTKISGQAAKRIARAVHHTPKTPLATAA